MSDRYAVIGHPIAHSRSPAIHAAFARQTGQDIEYERLLAPLDGFKSTVARFQAEGGKGLNVTLPFKLEAWQLADHLSERARAAGVANTLRFEGTRIAADNTDGIGLVTDMQGRLGQTIDGASVLLLGAGGAAQGVILPLLQAGVAHIEVVNRTADRAQRLASLFEAQADGRIRAAGLPVTSGRFDLLINATSSGLDPAQQLPIAPAVLAGARLAIDMVYAARPTAFMRAAHEAGCEQVSDGLGMLVEQAAESFFIWRGVRPETHAVYETIRAELNALA